MAVATDLDVVRSVAPPAGNRTAAVAVKAWSATWPKLLAIAIVIGAWQAEVWSHWKHEYLVPSPFTVLDQLVQHPATMISASWVTLGRGAQGFVLSMLIGGAVGIAVAHVPVLARGDRFDHHRPPDDALS